MIRITELKLPLDHDEHALPTLIVKTLGIALSDLISHTVYKRSYDARMKKLLLVYICDIEVASALETKLLKQLEAYPHIRPTPDQAYYPVVQLNEAPALASNLRPVVVGFGPAAFLPRCCWRKWASNPSCWSAAKKCVNAPKTPGGYGARVR